MNRYDKIARRGRWSTVLGDYFAWAVSMTILVLALVAVEECSSPRAGYPTQQRVIGAEQEWSWTPVPESDIAGYRLYVSNSPTRFCTSDVYYVPNEPPYCDTVTEPHPDHEVGEFVCGDDSMVPDGAWTYLTIIAVDNAGQTSAWPAGRTLEDCP